MNESVLVVVLIAPISKRITRGISTESARLEFKVERRDSTGGKVFSRRRQSLQPRRRSPSALEFSSPISKYLTARARS